MLFSLLLYPFALRSNFDDSTPLKIEVGLQNYRDNVIRGIDAFIDRNLLLSIKYFNAAAECNSSQPLVQRGICLYCIEDYGNAEKQLARDIKIIEQASDIKATDLRLWRSACLRKLGSVEDAIAAIDMGALKAGVNEERFIVGMIGRLYRGEPALMDIIETIGAVDDRDLLGTRFFGNFYLGLYFDSTGERELAKSFLELPAMSDRYPSSDLWHHVPRVLNEIRHGMIS
jgi:hypothetical protein